MSQEKVNKYKEEKANRKQIIKKQKRTKVITRIAGGVIGLAIVGWIGYSAYDSISEKIATSQTEVDITAIQDYMTDLTVADTATDEADAATDEADATTDEADAATDEADATTDTTEE